jgi:hypothetical protein
MMRVLVVAGLLSACTSEVTELLVVVDSDYLEGIEVDEVVVEARGQSARGFLAGTRGSPLPRTVGVVHQGGALSPIEIRASLVRGTSEVVSARVVTGFIEGKTLVVPIFLARACEGVACGGEETCRNGACANAFVDPATLVEWNGTLPDSDAGPPVCVPVAERCNDRDDDCDAMIDEDFDLMTDPIHCGMCNQPCNLANATSVCAAGMCGIGSCNEGAEDCNMNPADGCEAVLASSPLHCGMCGESCDVESGTGMCTDGDCEIASCEPDSDDCNMEFGDGCETSLTTTDDCGMCGNDCGMLEHVGDVSCVGTACRIDDCDSGWGDCNTMPADGCEAPLDTPMNCGGCGDACTLAGAETQSCFMGDCRVATCMSGLGNCNGDHDDGCEQMLNTLSDCGMCDRPCALSRATETCATGTCEIVMCETNRGDCDMNPVNGCEVDLRFDEDFCGNCSTECDPGDDCIFGTCM